VIFSLPWPGKALVWRKNISAAFRCRRIYFSPLVFRIGESFFQQVLPIGNGLFPAGAQAFFTADALFGVDHRQSDAFLGDGFRGAACDQRAGMVLRAKGRVDVQFHVFLGVVLKM